MQQNCQIAKYQKTKSAGWPGVLWPGRLTFATAGRLIAHTWCESGAHDDKGGGDHYEDHDNNNGDGDVDNNDDDDIYIMMKCVSVCVSRKIITSHFRADHWRREVSCPLGLAGRKPALA